MTASFWRVILSQMVPAQVLLLVEGICQASMQLLSTAYEGKNTSIPSGTCTAEMAL